MSNKLAIQIYYLKPVFISIRRNGSGLPYVTISKYVIRYPKLYYSTDVSHHSENNSVQELSYVNLPRSQRLISVNTHAISSRSKLDDDTESSELW